MAKRGKETTNDEDDDEDVSLAGDEDSNPPSRRKRTRTDKQKEIDKKKEAKEKSEAERLRVRMKKMQKEMEELKKHAQSRGRLPAASDDDNDDNDGDEADDKLPPESEEDDDDSSAEQLATLRPSLRKQATTSLKPAPLAQIRRREGEVRTSRTTPPTGTSNTPGSSLLTTPSSPEPFSASSGVSAALIETPPDRTSVPPSGHAVSTTPASLASAPQAESTLPRVPTQQTPELRPAPFRNGQEPTGGRPNVGDYVDDVRDLLLLAISRYCVSLFTINAFPGTAQQREFVLHAWKEVCAAQEHPVPWILSERMINAIGRRKSNARGDISDRIRPLIPEAYKFRTSVNKASEQYNITRSATLAENGTFHHKKVDVTTGTRTGFAEHKFLNTAIIAAYFPSPKTGVGFVYASHFKPLPEPALGLVLTVIHAHILEWSSGQRINEQFTEAANTAFYTGFCKDLEKYGKSNETAWMNIRTRYFERTFRAAGGITMAPMSTQVSSSTMSAATAELAQRTGLTDSEGEDDE